MEFPMTESTTGSKPKWTATDGFVIGGLGGMILGIAICMYVFRNHRLYPEGAQVILPPSHLAAPGVVLPPGPLQAPGVVLPPGPIKSPGVVLPPKEIAPPEPKKE
jgi:hypothetical protein